MKRFRVMMLAFAAVCAAEAAERSFETVPRQALVELKATIGKPFSAGLVFINGKFIPPPYKVERYGTALRVNGRQVTNQIISWDEFLKTQPGARVERTEVPVSVDSASAAPAPAAEQPEEDSASGWEDDFDDLFDDNPKPKKKKPARVVKKAAPSAPKVKSKVVFEGEFSHNLKTKKMLERLNKMRTSFDLALRKGGAFFFGTGYSTVRADPTPAQIFLDAIPAVMKNSESFEDFSYSARARGITFLSDDILRDLYDNRLDYIKLRDRARAVKEEHKWSTILKNSGL